MLYASGLFGVWMQAAVGSPVGWVGRTAQFLSGVYFLIAARAALRDAKASGVSVGAAIASFFRESELNYKTLVETLTDAIISTDAQGRILVWNRAAENMFGYVQGEAVGFTIEELAILPDFSKLKSNFAWAKHNITNSKHTRNLREEEKGRGISRGRFNFIQGDERRDRSNPDRQRHHRTKAGAGDVAGERGSAPAVLRIRYHWHRLLEMGRTYFRGQ